MPEMRTWHGEYPPMGATEAVVTIGDLEDGSYSVSVAFTKHGMDARNDRVAGTLDDAKAKADEIVHAVVGRAVPVIWRAPY